MKVGKLLNVLPKEVNMKEMLYSATLQIINYFL